MSDDLIARLLPPNGCHMCGEVRKEAADRIAELERTVDAREKESWGRLQRAINAEAECERLRGLLRKVLQATSPNMSMDMYAEVCRAIDAAIGKGN